MRLTKIREKHTITGLTDDELSRIYHCLGGVDSGCKMAETIREHLINSVSEDDLKNSGASTAEEYIANWLDF